VRKAEAEPDGPESGDRTAVSAESPRAIEEDASGAARTRVVAPLVGLAALALVASPSPPHDPFLTLLRAFFSPERAHVFGKVLSVALAIPALAGVVSFLAIFVRSVIERAKRKKREEEGERYTEPIRGRWRAMLFLVVALALAGELVASLTRIISALAPGQPQGSSVAVLGSALRSASQAAGKEALRRGHGSQTGLLLGIMAAIVIAIAAGLAVRAAIAGRAKASREKAAGRAASSAAMRRAADLALEARSRLELGDDVRRTVLSCYEATCGLFAPRPSPERPRMETLTAREFLAYLRKERYDDPELEALTGIFEKARYSDEVCTEDDRASAIAGLRSLEERYRGDVE